MTVIGMFNSNPMIPQYLKKYYCFHYHLYKIVYTYPGIYSTSF